MTTMTYRHGRGWAYSFDSPCGHDVCRWTTPEQAPTWRRALYMHTPAMERRWRAVSHLRRAFPRRDLDIHHDADGWYVRVVRISGNVTVSLHSGRRRRSLRDAVRVVIAQRRKELAR